LVLVALSIGVNQKSLRQIQTDAGPVEIGELA